MLTTAAAVTGRIYPVTGGGESVLRHKLRQNVVAFLNH